VLVSAVPITRTERSKPVIAILSLLAVLVVAQAAALVVLNRRLTNANTEQRRVTIAANAKINSLQSRTAQLEAGRRPR
jgi:hypothetical protein